MLIAVTATLLLSRILFRPSERRVLNGSTVDFSSRNAGGNMASTTEATVLPAGLPSAGPGTIGNNQLADLLKSQLSAFEGHFPAQAELLKQRIAALEAAPDGLHSISTSTQTTVSSTANASVNAALAAYLKNRMPSMQVNAVPAQSPSSSVANDAQSGDTAKLFDQVFSAFESANLPSVSRTVSIKENTNLTPEQQAKISSAMQVLLEQTLNKPKCQNL
jgi:hypothetical protein